jgi:hypothetical protein
MKTFIWLVGDDSKSREYFSNDLATAITFAGTFKGTIALRSFGYVVYLSK